VIESGFLERVRHVTAQASGLLDKISNLPRVFNATQLKTITCDGHKYTFVEERTGGFRIDRHGEEWVSRRDLLDVPGSNAFTALFFEAVNLKRCNSDLECELEILRKRRG
jgi:hypothetical protein